MYALISEMFNPRFSYPLSVSAKNTIGLPESFALSKTSLMLSGVIIIHSTPRSRISSACGNSRLGFSTAVVDTCISRG